MVTGRIERGVIKVGEEVEIVGIKDTDKTTCGVEMFRKLLDEGQAGDNVGVLLRGTKREVERGQVLAHPGSINPQFEAEVYILSKEEGGRLYSSGLPPPVLLPDHRRDWPVPAARWCGNGDAR